MFMCVCMFKCMCMCRYECTFVDLRNMSTLDENHVPYRSIYIFFFLSVIQQETESDSDRGWLAEEEERILQMREATQKLQNEVRLREEAVKQRERIHKEKLRLQSSQGHEEVSEEYCRRGFLSLLNKMGLLLWTDKIFLYSKLVHIVIVINLLLILL